MSFLRTFAQLEHLQNLLYAFKTKFPKTGTIKNFQKNFIDICQNFNLKS